VTAPEVEVARWQRTFFNMLEEFFARAYKTDIYAITPNFGAWIRTNVTHFGPTLASGYQWIFDQLAEYYEETRKAGVFGLGKRLGGVKLVLGGSSRFNEAQLSSVRKMVLYSDTILIPDPILPWIEAQREEERFRDVLMAENAYYLLHLKPLIDADLPYPPVVVFPSWEKTLEAQDPQTKEGQELLVTGVLSVELGCKFGNFSELLTFASDKPSEFLTGVDQKRLLVGPGGKPGAPLETSLRLYEEEIHRWRSAEHQKWISKLSPSKLVLNGLLERIEPMYHLFENAEELVANPMLPLEVHWHYYRLCSRFFEKRLNDLGLLEERVMAEIQALEAPSHEWLGDLPIKDLVELRRRGQNELFRTRMREFTSALQASSFADLNRVSSEINRAISALILEHQTTIREIQERYQRHALNTALLTAVTVAAKLVPTLAPLLGGMAILAPAGKLAWDTLSRRLDQRKASRSLMGILAEGRKKDGA